MGIRRESAPHRIKASIVVFAITRHVEPKASPAFPVLRGGEQAIYHSGESIRRLVTLERLNRFRRRWNASQIKCRASQQRAPIRRSYGRESFFLQARQNEAINFSLRPTAGFDGGHRRRMQRLKGPECAPRWINQFTLRSNESLAGSLPDSACPNPLRNR